jgi:UDP-N-acetyl-D-galactosamine dehydrogenase
VSEPAKNAYDAIIIGVSHNEYLNLDESYFTALLRDGKGAIIDVKGLYRGKIKNQTYWSL